MSIIPSAERSAFNKPKVINKLVRKSDSALAFQFKINNIYTKTILQLIITKIIKITLN